MDHGEEVEEATHDIVIIGGGIIGVSTAYFLAKHHDIKPLILEAKQIAWAASGKAGGFLARGWSQDAAAGPFSEASFDFHEELAKDLEGEKNYQYRKLKTLELFVPKEEENEEGGGEGNLKEGEKELLKEAEWITGGVTRVAVIGTEKTTAQVHPKELTQFLLDEAMKHGTTVLENSPVVRIEVKKRERKENNDEGKEGEDTLVLLQMNDRSVVRARKIVLCAGPWTHVFCGQLPSLPFVAGLLVPSVVIQPTAEISPHAIFGFMAKGKKLEAPEIYPRPDGTVYICGLADPTVSMPDIRKIDLKSSKEDNDEEEKEQQKQQQNPVPPNLEKSAWLHTSFGGSVSSHLLHGERLASQACFVPTCALRAAPFIGLHSEGVYVAANHGVWGILMGPLTGMLMSLEIVRGGVEEEVEKRGIGEAWRKINKL